MRCRDCYTEALATGIRSAINSNPNPAPPERVDPNLFIKKMDEAFCKAMMRAVEAGLERPPGRKVSTKPCTQRPVFVDLPRTVSIRSASALLVEAAGVE